jgi:hypothetical protein
MRAQSREGAHDEGLGHRSARRRGTAPRAALAIAALLAVTTQLAITAACGDGIGSGGKAARLDDEPGPPIDPEIALADEEEMPVDPDEDCGLDDGGLDEDRRAGDSPFAGERVGFALRFGDEVNPHRLMSAFVMPGETLEIQPVLGGSVDRFRLEAESGEVERREGGGWRWTAPETPGVWCLKVTDTEADETMCLNAFVLTPYDGGETLNGYRIGSYPGEPPAGVVEVTEENWETWVSPHFQLKQFLCKQESGWPKYLVLHTRLLLKLEMLLEEINEQGIPADSLYVMSGYRTPFYNRSIGNRTSRSRHTVGDAADVFVDRNRNGMMDDLDGDRRVTVDDARILYRMVADKEEEAWYQPFVGGLGLYPPAPHRGPFIHVDTRGHPARW